MLDLALWKTVNEFIGVGTVETGTWDEVKKYLTDFNVTEFFNLFSFQISP